MRFVCMKNEVKQVSARSRMLRWCSIYLTERPLVFILAAAVGLGAGCMAWLLKMAIRYISELVIATVAFRRAKLVAYCRSGSRNTDRGVSII